MNPSRTPFLTRRAFLRWVPKGLALASVARWPLRLKAAEPILNDVFWIKGVPDEPFYLGGDSNFHAGVDSLFTLMGKQGLKLYRSADLSTMSGPAGLISAGDVVLVKVNAQWKYRGCTNSDLVRGLVQRLLDHPDGFHGEIVILDNTQGQGNLACDRSDSYDDSEVHANAQDESHSFLWLVEGHFNDPRVTSFLLDPLRFTFIGDDEHQADGYRIYENVSYPCFTTAGRRRVELREGIWNGTSHDTTLKLINVPVLKHHDVGGSEITGALKNVYGILSMGDDQHTFRHYVGLGETCGKMMASICPPVLNILDATWVSHLALRGYPASRTYRSNQLLASQDPVALDYWAAKYVLYPIDNNARHHPDFPGITSWLTGARDTINSRGGMAGSSLSIGQVTSDEAEMRVFAQRASLASKADVICSRSGDGVYRRSTETGEWTRLATPGVSIATGDFDGDSVDDLVGIWPSQGGVWIKFSSSGEWSRICGAARSITTGDMTGDGRSDLVGTWDGDGVYYRDFAKGAWVKMATPASQVVAGDLDRDGKDDIIGIWPEQGGVWVKYSGDSSWAKLATIPDCIAVGDMNGDGRADLVGSWARQGVFYRDSADGSWVRLASPAAAIASGDLDGDGIDDLVGIWPSQGGVWVRYSKDGSWQALGTVADFITTGRMIRPSQPLPSGLSLGSLLNATTESLGPNWASTLQDRSSGSPGSGNFTFKEEKNLFPYASARVTRIPGPGEVGFRWIEKGRSGPGTVQAPGHLRKRSTIGSPHKKI